MINYTQRQKARAAAEAAAAALAARGPVSPPADEPARVAGLLAVCPWVFAKTMPHNPHEYTLRRAWERDGDFVPVVQFIRFYGYVERFPDPANGWPYVMMKVGRFKYWTMGDRCEPGPYGPGDTILINRKPLP
jgi:hypothetical protein